MNAPSPGLVTRLSPDLTGRQRQHLRGLGHHLQPVVLVGQRGISENLMENVSSALLSHELIKVKVHDSDDMPEVAQHIHDHTSAQLVQKIGKVMLFFKAHPDEPKIKLPG